MTNSRNDSVSVILPNYNYKNYLKARILSILRQTHPVSELIILDDASIDGSQEYISQILPLYRNKFPETTIKFLPNSQNSGKAISQWKKGFKLATGSYVWIAEADDLCSKNFLKEVLKPFSEDPEVVLSYSESKIINSFGIPVAPNFRFSRDKEKTGRYNQNYIKPGRQEIEEILAIRCSIPNVSAVIFKNSPEKIPYQKYLTEALKFSQAGDWYFYSKILEHGKIAYNRKSLNSFRVHKNSKTANSKKDKLHYKEILTLHDMFTEKYNLEVQTQKYMKDEEKRLLARFAKDV